MAPLRSIAKPVVRALLPVGLFERIQATRSRRHQLRFLQGLGLIESTKRYIERNGTIVRHGPFSGMIYPVESALNRHSIPKLLGTYESELHEVLSLVARRRYDCVIDIGSAEGYYAVGMALLTRRPVFAYDPEPAEKNLCGRMAELTGVGNLVSLHDMFTASDLPLFAQRQALVISDCEGFEAELFTPETMGLMSNWDIIVELHGTGRDNLPKMNWPHATRVIGSQPRTGMPPFQEIAGIAPAEALLSEYRGEKQFWLWCDSRDHRTS
jgi:hypothetical protein